MTASTLTPNARVFPLHGPTTSPVSPHVVVPALRMPEAAAAMVFAAVRQRGPVARDVIATQTGLSIATVNRQVSALLDARLLRERPDLAATGAIGRPRIQVEINHEPYLTIGLHIGARTTSIVASDLRGRILDAVETPTPSGTLAAAMASLAESALRYQSRWRRRRALWAGVAIGGVVDSAGGTVDHPRLGWTQAPVGPVVAAALGLPVSVASHVDAMAGAELLLGRRVPAKPERGAAHRGNILYVYARETVGFAQVIDGRVHVPAGGPGTVAGLPAYSELLGGSGTLESTVSDEAVVAAARAAGILAGSGPKSTVAELLRLARTADAASAAAARELLDERARVLGGAVALLRDMLNPDDLVVGGQAFTEYPGGMAALRAAYVQRSLLGARDLRVTAFGNHVQEAGAGVVSLSSIYADPLSAVQRARHRSAAVGSGRK